MVKKILLGVLFTALAGGLVYGGVVRTAARSESGFEQQSQGQGRYARESVNAPAEQPASAGERGGYGGKGGSGNGGSNLASPEGLAKAETSFEYTASVVEADGEHLLLRTSEGTEILVEGRAWRFALDAGFAASINDAIELAGFYDDDGVFEVSWITNLTTGFSVSIRNESGRPNWAGGGSGGGGRS